MGHDIYAYKKEEVGYLRRSAFSEDNSVIYELLNCTDLDGGVSGVGSREFTKEEVEAAITRGKEDKVAEDIIEFLEKALEVAEEDYTVEIYFG